MKICNTIHTRCTIPARIRGAIVNVDSAIRTSETIDALTPEPVDSIDAFSAIVTRLWIAIVDVFLTMVTFKSFSTQTLIIIAIVDASTTIETRI